MEKNQSQSEKVDKIRGLLSDLENSFETKKSRNVSPNISDEQTEDYRNLRIRALKYIGADRGRSYGQVNRVLSKQFPEIAENNKELIDQVILALIQDGYLDEKLCGRRLIKRHSGRKQKSIAYLEYLLKKQGISDSVITELMLEIPTDEETANNYFNLKKDEWDYDNPEKIIRHFASRGYSSGITLKIMRKYANGEE
ncbi:MAG: hypothetical protein GX909_05450 [Clostridiaceae bacterium]|nr:hypothetical protein [Clostridiaceae bacterium]